MLDLFKLINPTERQLEFLRALDKHRFVLYGGAAGGGKSYILRWWLVLYLIALWTRYKLKDVTVGLFCEDYPTLSDRQIAKIEFEFPRELGELRRGVTKDFVLNPEWGSGVIALRNLDDPSKYQSAEFAAIAVDELTKNDKDVFDFLRLRLRWPQIERPRFAAGTNPGGKGHGWVKGLWVDREFPPELANAAKDFAFVQAKATDNPHLSPQYWEDLLTLPKDMADLFVEGRWDKFLGQYFDVFDPNKHVRRPETFDLQRWWTHWISIDWGFEHPSAVYWHCSPNGGRIYTYRELVAQHLTPIELAKQIAVLNGDEPVGHIYLSPDAWQKRTSPRTVADEMGDVFVGFGLPRPDQADDDRVGGWMLMYSMLKEGTWTIASNCAELIKSLPKLVRDDKKVEDVAKIVGDDPADAARYGIKSHIGRPDKPREVRIAEKVTADDLNERILQYQKAEAEERKRAKPIPLFKPRYVRRQWWRESLR